MIRKPRICFVSPWNYPLFNPENRTHFGGWEVRVALIAKEIARRKKFKVFLVVGDHGQAHVEYIDGVTLYSWMGREVWGIPHIKHSCTDNACPNQPTGFFQKFWNILSGKRNRDADVPFRATDIACYTVSPELVSVYDEINADIYTVPGNSQFSGELA
jgi:hypothetical protein